MPKSICVLLLLLISSPAFSAGLANRTSNYNGNLLPKDLWIVGYDYGQSLETLSRYTSSGEKRATVEALQRQLTAADLAKNAGSEFDKKLALSAFKVYGIESDDTAATVVNDLQVQYQASTFVLGRGISENLSLFFIAPNVKVDVSIDSRLEYSSSVKAMIQSLREQGQHSRADEIEAKAKDALKQQVNKHGYEDRVLTNWEGVPQFLFSGRYTNNFLKKRGFSFETIFIVPNEKDDYIDQIIPVEFMEEAPSLIQAVNYDLIQGQVFNWNLYTQYQLRSRFNKNERLPEEEKFGSESAEISVKYGNEWHLGTQASYFYNKLIKGFVNLSFISKEQDDFLYDGQPIANLEKDTEQELLLAGVGLQLDLVDSFLQKKFLVPMIVTGQYSKSLDGVNTFSNDIYSLNLMVFYK